jgi:hypothetical protein
MRRDLLRGMGLIDVIIGIGLMVVVFMAIFTALRVAFELAQLAKAKAVATQLASSRVEYLRSLSYASLGTVGGTPSGAIPPVATSTVSGGTYVVRTAISYIDDSADGTGPQDSNDILEDYKTARISVSYVIHGKHQSLVLVSNFIPTGIEQ